MSAEAAPPAAAATAEKPPARPGRARFELFTASFAILFLELACIRWFGSMVVFLSFFTNLVLMACFLGMSVGCLAAARNQDWNNAVIPLALWMVLLACGSLAFY